MDSSREIVRDRLLNLAAAKDVRFVALFAAAGYGKSTLIRQVLTRTQNAHCCDLSAVRTLRDLQDALASAALSGASTVVFENAEALARIEDAQAAFSSALARMPMRSRCIIASRTHLDIPFLNFALPHEVAIVDERQLAFDRRDLESIAAPEDIDAVLGLTRGWPICVRLVARLAELRGGRDLVQELRAVDFSLLHEYLVRNVIEEVDTFTRSTLLALAMADLTDDDIRRLFAGDAPRALKIISTSPFIASGGGRRVLHPLVRDAARRWYEAEVAADSLRISEGAKYRFSLIDGTLHRGGELLHPTKREYELLAYLAFRDSDVSKDELAEIFAPDEPSADADRLLRVTVTRIRKKFGGELIVSTPGGYALGPSVEVPLRAMRARAARSHMQDGQTPGERIELQHDLQRIEEYLERRRPGYEWGEDLDANLERLAASIRETLQRAGMLTSSG